MFKAKVLGCLLILQLGQIADTSQNSTFSKLVETVGASCNDQMALLDPTTRLMMFDASSKIPNGIFDGNFIDLGNFDECYKIEALTPSGKIYGKYCMGTTVPPAARSSLLAPAPKFYSKSPKVAEDAAGFPLHLAICVSSACRAAEIESTSFFDESYCYSQVAQPELDDGAVTAIVIISIFLIIVAISSIYEIFIHYSGAKVKHELLIAFSALSNGRKLFTTTSNPDQLLCLNGLKSISMMWVILGHNYTMAQLGPLTNLYDAYTFQTTLANMFIMNGTLAVDTFFVVAGLVTVYTFLRATDRGVKFNIPLYYLHRFLRLTPAYAICILVHAHLLKYLGNGPYWGEIDDLLATSCKSHWWASVFYFANYVQKFCLPQTWYLSVDMQLFLLSPLILVPLKKFPKYTVIALVVLFIAGIVVPFSIVFHHELDAFSLLGSEKFSELYYTQTYGRFGTYVMGMILGYVISRIRKTGIKIPATPKTRLVALALWLAGLAILLACIYAWFDAGTPYNKWIHSLFVAFNRPMWSVGVSLVIFLCVTGFGGPINAFLSLPIFQILTKISYSMYLVHYALISIRYSSMKTQFRFSNIQMMTTFWGDFVFTAGISTVLCLTFESPIIALEKIIFSRGKSEVKKTTEKTEP